MSDEKLIAAAIENGKTVVLDDNWNYGESLTLGLYESHDSFGQNYQSYGSSEDCVAACLKAFEDEEVEFEIL